MALDFDDSSDVAATLLSDSDEAPPAASAAEKRGRGRPRGSGKRASTVSASGGGERLAGVNEMAAVLSKLIGLASVLLALSLVGYDNIEAVAMTAQEAHDIAEPAARLLRKSKLARQTSALVTRGGDVVALTVALVGYTLRVWGVAGAIRQTQQGQRRAHNLTGGISGHQPVTQPVRADTSDHAASHGSNGASAGASFGGPGIAFSDPDANLAATRFG